VPTIPQSDLPKPKSWDEFEDIVWNIYSREWHDPHAERNGRSDQRQHGVDIYGQPWEMGGRYAGIQCKRLAEGRLTQQAIDREVAEAEEFVPPLAEYLIATTESRDAVVQEVARQIDEERRQAGKFRVHLVFWETLCDRLSDPDNADLLHKHYGDWLGRDSYTPPPLPDPDVVPDPGPLPPGSRLPFPRNALFTGRVDPLKDLAGALLHGGAGWILVTQAVQGMGGMGKTQLAVEFAYRYGRYFRGVHWLNAARPEMVGTEVAECGLAMGLPDWPDEQPEQVAYTLKTWSEGGPRLVVLDNLEEAPAAGEWLGRLGGLGTVRVLVTARRSNWPRELGLAPLRLAVFDPEESLALLRKYLPGERAADADLAGLAKRLGHLPLALKLAGRYLEGHPSLKVGSYVERLADALDDRSMEAWRDEQGRVLSEQDRDLLASFMLSWERVTDEAARQVFMMAGWCAPNEVIPGEVLEPAAGLEAEECDGAVGMLAGLGLVERETGEAGPKVHPLLAEFGRKLDVQRAEREGGEGEGALAAVAKALAGLAIEANMTQLPARFVPLPAHVETTAAWAEEAGLETAGILWNELGYHRRMVADYGGARAAFERAVESDERVYGPDQPDVARDVNNLGMVLRDLGDLAGARAAFERALGIWRAVYGEEGIWAATAHSNLVHLGINVPAVRRPTPCLCRST
jgi:tetratricopeptide (TPR) repeat protein